MNFMKINQYYHRFWKQIFMYSALIWIVFFCTTFYFEGKKYVDDDLEKTLVIALQHIDELHRINKELIEMKNKLNRKLKFNEKQIIDKFKMLNGPSEGYEILRRRIYSNTKEFWYYISSSLQSLTNDFKDLKPKISHMKTMVDEHYRSLLSDVAKLADVDGYSQWRWEEFDSLSRLIQKRLLHTQNPPDCSKAKKLQCNLINNNPCGYGCRVHHFIKCLIVAYATERTMIIGTPKKWQFTSRGFDKLFLPLSDTCTSNDGETVSIWPENVVNVNENNDGVRNDFHRPLSDPFTLTEQMFIKNFRLTKHLTRYVIDLLRPFLKKPSRSSSIDIDTKVLVALNFFATGSYQTPVGNSRYTVLSQASVSCCIKEVVAALNNPSIFNSWVKFPHTICELNAVRHEFYLKTGFPGVIGCLDCTHVAIVPPSKNLNLEENRYPEYMYVNRKNYHSINVQLICDSNLKILNVNALFPGSTHDAHVWNNSNVSNTLQELHSRNYNNFFLLGDSGYPLRPWLLTPITHPTTAAEELYNNKQMSTRSIIERCNGVLKMRFRCLFKDRVLHYKPEKSSQIINACVVLHNMCIEHNVPEIRETGEDIDMEMNLDQGPFEEQRDNRNQYLMLGKQQRSKIIQVLQNRNL